MLIVYSKNSFADINSEKTVIISDKINKEEKDKIKAIGDVEVKKGGRIFNADEVEYNQVTKLIKANSDVKVYDTKKNNIFFAKKASVLDDFTSGEFSNGIVIFENGSSISSPTIRKANDSDLISGRSIYAVCPTDMFDANLTYEDLMLKLEKAGTPLFSLRSGKINANTEDKQMNLFGTSVWIWKVPVFYIPYLKTGLAFNKKVDGFGMPGLEKTNHYGYGVYVPYSIFNVNKEFALTPKLYQEGNYLLNLKYNAFSKDKNKWSFNFKGDIVNDNEASKELANAYGVNEFDEGNYKNARGYFESNGFYNFNDLWSFDYNASLISDRYYLRDYYRSGLSYTQSNLTFTNVNMNELYNFDYMQLSNLFYQELLENDSKYINLDGDNDYNSPRYAPVFNLNRQKLLFSNGDSDISYRLKINTTNLFRKDGLQYNRATLIPEVYGRFKTNFATINTSLALRGDVYALKQLDENDNYYNNASRLIPQFNMELRKLFVMNNFTFQPIIKYSASLKDNKFEKNIPNEDSKSQTLSFENIFSNNRFIGYDRQESGNRITYGFESTIFHNLNIGLAQGYRDNVDTTIQKLVGFEDKISDYVGYTSYIFNDYFDVYYRFLVDKNNFKFKKNEVNLNLNTSIANMYLIYTNLDTDFFNNETQNQIKSGILFTIFKKWKFDISGTVDIENNNRIAQSDLGFIYDGSCVLWKVYFSNYNPLSETSKNTSINFSFTIKFL